MIESAMDMNYEKLLKEIKLIAIEQGELLERSFKQPETIDSVIKDNDSWSDIDVVTALDDKIEDAIYDRIHDKFPDLGFVLEEHAENEDIDKEFICYIDPIDGTKYFAQDIPLFCISIGVVRNGEPVLGVVYDPVAEQMYAGAEGIPTTLNSNEIVVSKRNSIKDAFISLDVATHKENWDREKDWMNKKIVEFNNSAKRVRLYGAGALSCAWTAGGGLDAFVSIWGHGSKPFDIAAGKALIKYAGGKIIDLDVPAVEQPRFIGANPQLADEIAELLLA
jgi:myo-inositol-1(or 4)-monophosphatase